jgi:hypothetical protein
MNDFRTHEFHEGCNDHAGNLALICFVRYLSHGMERACAPGMKKACFRTKKKIGDHNSAPVTVTLLCQIQGIRGQSDGRIRVNIQAQACF